MKDLDRRTLLRGIGLGAALGAGLPPLPARASAPPAWRPSQPVRIIVPAASGGTTDIMGRLLGQHITQNWGQPGVVENKSGAGGTIGTAEVVRSRPDGHTILLGNIGPQAIAYSLFRSLPYRADQLIPVSNMIRGPNVLVVHPSLPVESAKDFIAYLRDHPGRLSYGTPGIGQSPHLSAVWFTQLTGTRATAVHYRGAGPSMMGLVAGEVQFSLDNLTSAMTQVREGRARALGVTSAERNPQLPHLPPLREVLPELASYEVNTWFGAFYPAGTPDPVVQALNGQIKALLEQPETRQRFAEMGGEPAYGTPAAYAAFVAGETEKWGAVLKREGLQLDAG
ncbi:tripartite tricarboxylate transporter substrate binding protein [Roseomonas sp. GC11]|uniref:Bug family tripartite tricarboxylate transporter substrate binding protein n=1 Tax=Roseomonas sp. GC11 TaxID=2950546 RepID=UPI00210C0BA8|nr:tripartite tricarboxylate transporter substrate binding protein [Roseomonas sp. GC11]MCQ4158627.1 tripartite tricarboxylate transporter substrate binding protein [Roseomonas sp. GC11]